MHNANVREPSSWESSIIQKLLSVDFPGRDELLAQLKEPQVVEIDENNSLKLLASSSEKALVQFRVPVEAEATDTDGVAIHILLHVVSGLATELEIYKDDSSKVLKPPNPEDITVFSYPIGNSWG